jgi:hypothetical protein
MLRQVVGMSPPDVFVGDVGGSIFMEICRKTGMIGDYHTICSGCNKSLTGNWVVKKIGLVAGFTIAGFIVDLFWFLAVWSALFVWGPITNCGCTQQQSGN